jgi:hypothetical protein
VTDIDTDFLIHFTFFPPHRGGRVRVGVNNGFSFPPSSC